MATIEIEGHGSFEIPENLNLREMRILERYSQGHLGDGYEFAKLCGIIHVAIARVKKDVSFEEIQEVVDEIDAQKLESIVAGQSPPAESSSENVDSSSEDSDTPSDAPPENGSQSSSGSQDLAFSTFHQPRSAI